MSCKSILVVEDDEDIRDHVVQALEAEDHRVFSAENGKVALDFLLNASDDDLPGCIILDLMMPVMDGKTMMQTIDKYYKDKFGMIPVLIATAKGSPVDQNNIPQSVARIQKPFDLDELYQAVEKHCGKPPKRTNP